MTLHSLTAPYFKGTILGRKLREVYDVGTTYSTGLQVPRVPAPNPDASHAESDDLQGVKAIWKAISDSYKSGKEPRYALTLTVNPNPNPEPKPSSAVKGANLIHSFYLLGLDSLPLKELVYALDDYGFKVMSAARKQLVSVLEFESTPTLMSDPERALDVAANTALLCLSEDNVSCEVLVVN